MTLVPAAKWPVLLPLVSVVLVGCGAFEAPPPEYPHATVTFDVTVPADTPADAAVSVVGSDSSLGGEQAPGFHLRRAGDHFQGTVRLSVGADISYDVWVEDVCRPELSAEGASMPRHTLHVEGDTTVSLQVARWGAPGKGPPPPRGLTGLVRYQRGVTSHFLSRPRDVIVYLPPGYFDDAERRYPVLYMHDGQNLMDATTATAGEWGVDETAERLIQAGEVEPVIIVGVSNTPDRVAEYTPAADAKYGGGNADAYGRFLVEELKPLIEARYRTRTGAADTGLAGSSLGGLASLYLGMKFPETFTRLGVMSPSVGWANRDIVGRVDALTARPPLRIWLDVGTNEDTDAVSDARRLREALSARGWSTSDLHYVEVDGAASNESAWAQRFGDVLRYLFPTPR